MRQWTTAHNLTTSGRGFHELTGALQDALDSSGVVNGLLHVFLRHTSASLLITENADADVQRDLETVWSRLGPDDDPQYRHVLEGSDDMAAHVRSALTSTEISVPVRNGRLATGTWQGVFLWEHRHRPHKRSVEITIMGD